MACENNLFIQIDSLQTRMYFESILRESDVLFQSFVPLFGTKEECYGTGSDVYMEYILVDKLQDILKLVFYTHETPCIEFCKRLAAKYSVNIQLVYLNEENDYSGELQIYRNQITKNDQYSYYQGLYIHEPDDFWEDIEELFENLDYQNIMEVLTDKRLILSENDFLELRSKFNEILLLKQFKKL